MRRSTKRQMYEATKKLKHATNAVRGAIYCDYSSSLLPHPPIRSSQHAQVM